MPIRMLSAAALAAMLTVPGFAHSAEESAAATTAIPASGFVKKETDGAFTALQIGKKVHVYNENGQIFHTQELNQIGPLVDLFLLPDGSKQLPFILVNNEENGLIAFTDLWPHLTSGLNTSASNTIDAYDSGRVFYTPQDKIISKTGLHYAEQKNGQKVVVYSANDYGDLEKGYREAFRTDGQLRGLILYDYKHPYVVVEKEGRIRVLQADSTGAAEQVATINL
ncbi:hypothetical protein WBG83_17210 [Paenibacillus sp. y28]